MLDAGCRHMMMVRTDIYQCYGNYFLFLDIIVQYCPSTQYAVVWNCEQKMVV